MELALTRYGDSGLPEGGDGAKRNGNAANQGVCPVSLQDYSGIAAQLASANESGTLVAGPEFASAPEKGSAGGFDLRSRKNVILCAALLYAKLEGIEAQRRALSRQQIFADRLMDIESRRVHADFDDPILLTEAKLLRARTRLESVALGSAERKARLGLSALVGLAPGQLDTVRDTMPLLPEKVTSNLDDTEVLRQLVAFRDIVQLEYVSEQGNRMRATRETMLAKASIGRLAAARVTEEIAFNALLGVNNRILLAKIQLLGESGELEDWAFGRDVHDVNRPPAPESPANAASVSPDAPGSGAKTPYLLSILISPATKELAAGKSQQYSAIATYSDGHSRDVSTEANWACSSDTAAILSTTGLLTGLAAGEVAVSAEHHGLTHSRKLTVVEEHTGENLLPVP